MPNKVPKGVYGRFPRYSTKLGEFVDPQGVPVSQKRGDPLGALAGGLLEGVDIMTGIPTAVRDPSLANIALAGAGVVPVGRLARPAAGLLRRGGKTIPVAAPGLRTRVPTRKLVTEEGEVVETAAARTAPGRAVERAYDIAQLKVAPGRQAHKARTIAERHAAREKAVFGDIQGIQPGPAGAEARDSLSKRLLTGTVDSYNDLWKGLVTWANVPGYHLGQAASNAFLAAVQGSLTPWSVRRATRVYRGLSQSERQAAHKLAGTGFTKALETGAEASFRLGKTKAFTKGRDVSAAMTDTGPRFLALVYEAAKEGYDTPVKFKRFLRDPKLAGRRAVIGDRVNEAMVDFGRMSQFEAKVISRAIPFYPWARGAAHFALRSPIDRPVSTALTAYGALRAFEGSEGRPWYSRLDVKVPGTEFYAAPFRLTPLLQPFQTLQPLTGGEPLIGQLSPAVQTLTSLATGRGEYGQRVSPLEAVTEPFSELPQERLGKYLVAGQEKGGVYPISNRPEAAARLLGGGTLGLRRIDEKEALERGRGKPSAEESIRREFDQKGQKLRNESAMFGIEEVPNEVMGALGRYEQATLARTAMKERLGAKKLTAVQDANILLDIMVREGVLSFGESLEIRQAIRTVPPSLRKKVLSRIETAAFGEYREYRGRLTEAVNAQKAGEEALDAAKSSIAP